MFDGLPKELVLYETADGKRPLDEWRESLRDRQTRAVIVKRLQRLERGNPGDYKTVGSGVYELRIDFGPGYRLYFTFADQRIVLLLTGGDKSTQTADIKNACAYWEDYQKRVKR